MRWAPRTAQIAAPGETLRPIVGVDIDGTLALYHEHFIRFFSKWVGQDIDPRYDGSVPLYKWCGVSKDTYRKGKLAYRLGGLKRSMPVYPYAADTLREWRRAGALVAICTTRPFLSLEAVEKDTLHFLRRNGLQHDFVIHGEKKYHELARFGTDRIAFVVDDLPEMVQQAHRLGMPAILRHQRYNEDFEWMPAVGSVWQLCEVGLQHIEAWKGQQ
jgi:hypothetical protein